MKTFIDENMIVPGKIERDDVVWYDASEKPFVIYGADNKYNRLPLDFPILSAFRDQATGVRVRFTTDSPFVAIRCILSSRGFPLTMSATAVGGFDLYKRKEDSGEVYVNTFRMPQDCTDTGYESLVTTSGENTYTINAPVFSHIEALFIGVKEGSKVSEPKKYNYLEKPIVFYGSSITNGASASRPGNSYCAMISQMLGANYLNMGFSGNARGEQVIADYIAKKDMCAFVLDYHHNAYDLEILRATHYNFYKTVRLKNPFIPIVMVTAPTVTPDDSWIAEGVKIIQQTYQRAKEEGDKYVYFVDGCHLYDGEFQDSCTVDGCHPNDLGFFRMAKGIGRTLAAALETGFKP